MQDSDVKTFEALRKAYKEANKARKEAVRAGKAVKGLGGKRSRLVAMASGPGTRAANAELDALNGQIRALEKLLGFARSAVDGGTSARLGDPTESPNNAAKKARKARKKAAKKSI